MNPELLQKYIAGNATEVEKQRVTGWIQENPENMREYMAQRKLHDMALWRTEPVAEENSRERKHFSLRGICMEAAKIAAVLAIVLLGTHYWTGKHQVPEDKTWQSIYVPAGQRAELMLADGTKVWLSSRSTLTFPGSFKGDIRNVKLDGEGYFAVTKNVEQPFIVETNKCNVKVLGTEFNVMAQALGENASPVMITQSEYMRRMKEMANIQAGMSFYGEMPDMFNLVLNADHKLVKEILADEDKECAAAVAPIQKEMDDVNTRRNELKKKQEGKKDEDIPTAEKDEVNDLDKKWEDLKNRKNGLFANYAAQNKVVRQLIDLALLQNGMLKGEALNNFVKRSIDLIK